MEKFPFGRMGELVSAVSVRTGTISPEQTWTFERLLRQELPRATVHVCSGREVEAPYAAAITCPPFVHSHVTEHVALLARMAVEAHPVTLSSTMLEAFEVLKAATYPTV
jgi:hypothetical protein